MADPIELLESFPRSLSGGAPTPDELRKRGDRRRNRHRAAGAVAALAAVAAIVTPLALNNDDSSTTPPPSDNENTISVADTRSLEGTIPAQFPLLVGLPARATIDAESTGLLTLTACGKEFAGPAPVDAQQVRAKLKTETFERQLMTFGDHATAVTWVQSALRFFEDCDSEPAASGGQLTHSVNLSNDPSGLPVSILSRTTQGGETQPGGQLDQLYVVGRAVLVTRYVNTTVEGSDSAPWDAQEELAGPVAAAMGHEWVGFTGEYGGAFVEQANQVATKLDGASAGFQSFVAGLITDLQEKSQCQDAAVGITVDYVVDDTWAVGGVNDCGGYRALWGRTGAGWKELMGTQDMWSCADLNGLGVPEGVVGPCYKPGEE